MRKLSGTTIAIVGILFLSCSELNRDHPDADAAQCGICHGLPPVPPAADAFHLLHKKYDDCSICHAGYRKNLAVNAQTHQNGKVDVAFTRLFDQERRGEYDAATGTCSNVYCHGAFKQGTHAPITYPSPVNIGKNCQFCHDTGAIMQNHHNYTQQRDTVNNCGKCHPGYGKATGAMAGRFVNDTLHINGIVDTSNVPILLPKTHSSTELNRQNNYSY